MERGAAIPMATEDEQTSDWPGRAEGASALARTPASLSHAVQGWRGRWAPRVLAAAEHAGSRQWSAGLRGATASWTRATQPSELL